MKAIRFLLALVALAWTFSADAYINYDLITGEEVADSEMKNPVVKVTADDKGVDIDITVTHASASGPCPTSFGETYIWTIPMELSQSPYTSRCWGRPMIPEIKVLQSEFPAKFNGAEVEVKAAEYRDFQIPAQAFVQLIDPIVWERTNDYSGWWPSDARNLLGIRCYYDIYGNPKMFMTCCLMQYDAEHVTTRIYSHLKFRVNYIAEDQPNEVLAASDDETESGHRYMDLETGQEITLAEEYMGPDINVAYDDNGADVEIDVKYANAPTEITTPFGSYNNWSVPTRRGQGGTDLSWNRPKFSMVKALSCEMPAEYNAAEVIILGSEYRDFKSRISQTPFIREGFMDTEAYGIIPPFEGWWPTNEADLTTVSIISSDYKDNDRMIQVAHALSQYNYETETVRIYRHIKLRVNFLKAVEGGIETPEGNAAAGPVRYFDTQGREVTAPARGRIYILRRGDSAEKVRF